MHLQAAAAVTRAVYCSGGSEDHDSDRQLLVI